MREIKFRAWDKDEKEFCDGSKFVISSAGQCEEFVRETYMSTDRSRRFILMQFTGLKDKNGKEIYEGDVVEHTHDPSGFVFPDKYIYQMVWNDSGFALQGIKSDIPTSFILDKKLGSMCEIIGNIYENPELLVDKIVKE